MSRITEAIATLERMLATEQTNLIIKVIEHDLEQRDLANVLNQLSESNKDWRDDWRDMIVRILNDK